MAKYISRQHLTFNLTMLFNTPNTAICLRKIPSFPVIYSFTNEALLARQTWCGEL